ncbi:protein PPP1R35 homolog [Drosophila gunungcola]|uniref:Protein phosphatase 1 regulatory subunit 35 C-terminal domain-containing protein n=1 Tax=Drosophila gunungcola TaxID=103775 RepID=A0A9Q0BTD1_9MUSC|nr:protein PPP1R35 homolog [Drosophila gunungcola]KAI8043099.1 hypothetical protein M5D96_004425 [Drosophila gunungcola]
MPHKRKSRLNVNQKNSATRRVQSAIPSTTRPHVTTESCFSIDVEIPIPDSSKIRSGGLPFRRHFPVHKLAVPQYNSTVRKQDEIHFITQMLADTNVSPEAAAAIAPKVTQKMNFPPDKTVFKDLVPLNVNDSVLEPLKLKRGASKDKQSKESEPSKVSNEPQLADYVEKVEPIAMTIKEPELRLDYTQEPFDFLGAYKKVYH